MGDWAYVIAGYGLTGLTLVAYVVSLRRRAERLAAVRRRPVGAVRR